RSEARTNAEKRKSQPDPLGLIHNTLSSIRNELYRMGPLFRGIVYSLTGVANDDDGGPLLDYSMMDVSMFVTLQKEAMSLQEQLGAHLKNMRTRLHRLNQLPNMDTPTRR